MTVALNRAEVRLRSALREFAALAPRAESQWTDSDDPRRPSAERPPRRLVAGALGAAALALTGALLVTHDAGPWTMRSPPLFVPTGVEVPLTATAPDDRPWEQPPLVVKAGSMAAVTVPGQGRLMTYVSVGEYRGHVVQESCVPGACAPFSGPRPSFVALTSSVENGTGSSNLWIWTGLPDGTAFVQLQGTNRLLWQRPESGMVAFPIDFELGRIDAVAFDAAGAQLATASWATRTEEPDVTPREGLYRQLPQAAKDVAWQVIDTEMRSCLAARGDEAWDDCVGVADDAFLVWMQSQL